MNAFGQVPFRRSEQRLTCPVIGRLATCLTVCAVGLYFFAAPAMAAGETEQPAPPPVPLYSEHVSKSMTIAPGMMIITTKDSYETVVGWYRANLKDQLAEVEMGPMHRHYLTHNGAGVDVATEGTGAHTVTKISLFWKVGGHAAPGATTTAQAKAQPAGAPPPDAQVTDAAAPAELASIAPLPSLAGLDRRSIQELAIMAPAPKVEALFPPAELASIAPLPSLAGLDRRAIQEPAIMAPAPKVEALFPPAELASVAPLPSLAGLDRRAIQEPAVMAPAPKVEDLFPAPVELASVMPLSNLAGVDLRSVSEPTTMAPAPKVEDLFPAPMKLARVRPLRHFAGVEMRPLREPAVMRPAPTVEDLFPVVLARVTLPSRLAGVERRPVEEPTDMTAAPAIEDLFPAPPKPAPPKPAPPEPAPVELASIAPPLNLAGLHSRSIEGPTIVLVLPVPKIEEADEEPAPAALARVAPLPDLAKVDKSPIKNPAIVTPVSIAPPKPAEAQPAQSPPPKKGDDAAGESQGMGYFKQGRYAEALVAWAEAAARGSTEAALALGMMYDSGQGVPQSYTDAFSWYELAAEQDDPVALFNVGVLYDAGYGVAQDTTEAASWYERAVVRGSGRAAYNLALLYQKGDGVSQDASQAALYFKHAERLGVTPVQRHRRGQRVDYGTDEVSFNTIHTIGDDTRQGRLPSAAAQIESWADAGDPYAQYDLAYYCERGIGREIDLRRAYALYRKSADRAPDERLRRVAEAGAAGVKAHLATASRRRW